MDCLKHHEDSFSPERDRKIEPARMIPLRPAEEAAVQTAEIKKYLGRVSKPLDLPKEDFDELKQFEGGLNAKIASS